MHMIYIRAALVISALAVAAAFLAELAEQTVIWGS